MTTATFIAKNALRNKRRATLSVLSVAVSLFLLVTLLVALRELTLPPEDVGAALRVAVRNKISIAAFLPARQRKTIEKIPGVEAVSPFTWFGGKFRNEESMTFAQFAMDADKLTNIFGEAKMPLDQLEAWIRDRQGCVVGKLTADKFKLKIGDRVPITSTIFPCTIELTVRGIYQGSVDDRNLLFHHKYLDEAGGRDGWVGMWWLKVRSIEDMPRVTAAINQAFANTSAEVRAESERAFQLSFISMWGNIKMLIHSISSVVVFTLALVTASTMSMAIRERFQELAVLKALGFRRRELFAFILAESFGLALVGALLGVGGAWLAFTHTAVAGYTLAALALLLLPGTVVSFLRDGQTMDAILGLLVSLALFGVAALLCSWGSVTAMTHNIFLTLEVTPRIVGIGFLVAAALGIAASIFPSIAVARMSVVNGLKTLD
jgi:putative ABC transport system permease protein